MNYDEGLIVQTIAQCLEAFYSSLLEKIRAIDVHKLMKKKNPYLYRAKAMKNASEIVESVLNAYVSSSEETIFGNCFFEPLAIAASGGEKALAEGIDLVVKDEENNTVYAYAVKSGPSVFNADSKKRQEQNFQKAGKLAQQGKFCYVPIIGYGYGKKKGRKGSDSNLYQELAGKEFWTQLTGDDEFYLKIIKFMGDAPERYLESFKESYYNALNRLVHDFTEMFCRKDGSIDWEKLIQFNSGD